MNPPRTQGQIAAVIFGFLMLAVSSPCVMGMIYDVFIGGTDNVSGALIAGTFFMFVGIAGAALMALGLRKPKREPLQVNEALERRILSIARHHRGRLTVSEVAVDCELTIAEANEALAHFERHGVVRTHLSDAGDIVYVFSDFTVDKAAAIDPLDDEAVFDSALGATDEEAEAAHAVAATKTNEEW